MATMRPKLKAKPCAKTGQAGDEERMGTNRFIERQLATPFI
jgi:hypothetical protein